MLFCIECGAKLPKQAKFCPQCGAAIGSVETENITEADPVAETSEADISITNQVETQAKDDVTPTDDAMPSLSESLAATADATATEPKSKIGLYLGIGLLALGVAGGGAYATGLFDTTDKYVTQTDSTPVVEASISNTEVEPINEDKAEINTVLAAYQDAIKSGRISALGQFAAEHADHSLAKDAEAAAFASLKRQNSVLAYSTFTKYFPNADTRSYIGPRVNADVEAETDTPQPVEAEIQAESDIAPSIRSSISRSADELSPFIDQGNGDYAVAVIDEMLSLTDLTETEATYLLNLRATAETASGFITETASEIIVSETSPTLDIQPSTIDVTTEPAITETEAVIIKPTEAITNEAEIAVIPEIVQESETMAEPDVTPALDAEPPAPALVYDTAAKPIERFGAITPDAATEPGECDMSFSVDISGKPTNIFAACSDPLFIAPATETVGAWSYAPATLNGDAVQQDDIIVKIKFHLE